MGFLGKFIFCILLFLPLFTGLSAQQNPSITIANNTGSTIWYVYFKSTASSEWGQDRLASDQIISIGQSVTLQLPYPINVVNRYDMRLKDSDENEYIKMNVTVASNSRIEFSRSDLNSRNTTMQEEHIGPPITIVNKTGYTANTVYISSNASGSWGSNRLTGNQTLRNDQSISLRLPYPIDVVNRYDIRLKDTDDDTYTKMDVRVSANSRIEFTFDDFDRSTPPSITIVNNTGYSVFWVYFRRAGSSNWGSDRLASDQTISNGESVSLQLPYPINEVSRYDIRLEDKDNDTYTKMNVTVSANSRITFTFDDFD